MSVILSPIDRLHCALEDDSAMPMDARELGIFRTFASLLWRRPLRTMRGAEPETRERFIREYASLLTLLRLLPTKPETLRDELTEVFLAKYPDLRPQAGRGTNLE